MERNTTQWLKTLLWMVVGVGLVFLLYALGQIVRLVVIGTMLAYLLDPLARMMETRGVHRTVATVVIFLGLGLVIALLLFFLFPVVVAQLQAIQEGLTLERTRALIRVVEVWLSARLAFLGADPVNLLEQGEGFVRDHVADILNYVPGVVSILGDFVVVPFIMFFMLKDGRSIKKGLINSVPNRYFEFALNVQHKMDVQLGNYLRGQLLAALIVGILSTLALWILDVEYYLVIGVFAGLANLVPYLGPFIGAATAVIVSLFTNEAPGQVLLILAAFAGIQLIDNTFTQALIIARNVKLHPVVVLLAVLVGGHFFGFLGLLLAVPVTAVLKVFIQETIHNARRYRFD